MFVPRGVLAVSSPVFFFLCIVFVNILVIIGKFFPLCPYVLAVICSFAGVYLLLVSLDEPSKEEFKKFLIHYILIKFYCILYELPFR